MLRERSTAPALSYIFIAFCAVSSAQNSVQYGEEGYHVRSSLWATATAGKDHVRFASLGIGQRMRLEGEWE